MPLTIKRAKITLLASAALATIGLFMVKPQWPAIEIALISGVLSSVILIADIRKKGTQLGPFAAFPLVLGILIAQHSFSAKLAGRGEWGNMMQLFGIAMINAVGISFIYLLKQNEKKT